jgi:hypothetical protein
VSGLLGQLGMLIEDHGDLWILGARGAAVRRAESAAWSYYSAPEDIPEGPVRDLLPLGDVIWLATPAGALRVLVRN